MWLIGLFFFSVFNFTTIIMMSYIRTLNVSFFLIKFVGYTILRFPVSRKLSLF